MRILVTGGAGYLGCPLTAQLLKAGCAVRLLDRFAYGEEPIAALRDHPAFEAVQGDVRRLQDHPKLLDGVDAIVHLASLTNDPSCSLDEDMAEDVNVESARELAHQALQSGVRRFVLASTCSVYGQGVFELLDEHSSTHPVGPYGATSLRAEEALLSLRNDRFEPVVARLGTLFGWSPRMRFDLAVNQMVATALQSGTIHVLGGGNQWRPFLHVDDAAAALRLLLNADGDRVAGEVFNVGDDALNCRIRDLADRVAAHFSAVEIDVARDDDDLRTFNVQFEKIRDRLGFRATVTIDEGIREVKRRIEETGIDPSDERFFNVRTLRRLLATPVEQGGEPIAPRFIPLYRPSLGPEEEQAVLQTLRSGWLTSAARVPVFEELFAETVGARYAVAVASCTAALHLALVEAGVRPGDEVIMTPLTWASTANTIVHMGAKPVFVDVDPATLNMDPAQIEPAITDRTRAIMPVHLGGLPCDMDAIVEIADRRGVRIIEDAAHALGAKYRGVPIGGHGRWSCFSFYAIKNITTIDGGAIVLDSEEEAERFRMLSSNGMQRSAWDRYGRSSGVHPDVVVTPGFKYRLTDVGAAMGIAQLRKLPGFQAARARLARLYRTALADIEEITLQALPEDREHAWHLQIIRLKLDRLRRTRDEIRYDLRRENVGAGLHFYGLHLHDYYRQVLGLRPEDLPHATEASYDMLSLPLFPLMDDKAVQQVANALRKVIAHALR